MRTEAKMLLVLSLIVTARKGKSNNDLYTPTFCSMDSGTGKFTSIMIFHQRYILTPNKAYLSGMASPNDPGGPGSHQFLRFLKVKANVGPNIFLVT